jgi:uncharacterized protein YdeI (YjbR/CyaY-like superfamily)
VVSDGIERIYATNAADLHDWLAANHATSRAVWLVFYKKASGLPSVSWSDAVDEALCFGWIDSKVKQVDEERYEQYFTPRKPTSVWSQINKEKVDRLIAEGRMEEPGMRAIEVAKKNGSWTILDGPNALVVPDDLAAALDAEPAARRGYEGFSASTKRAILAWIALAKRPDTRDRRIATAVADAAVGRRPVA